jgi:hypothetical protein
MRRKLLEMRKRFLGIGHESVAYALCRLADILALEKRLAKAESTQRNRLAIREMKFPDSWRTFDTRSRLGGILVAQNQCSEAEPLLLSGYAGMSRQQDRIAFPDKPRLQEALERMVQLYEVSGRPDEAAEWRKKRVELDKASGSANLMPPANSSSTNMTDRAP